MNEYLPGEKERNRNSSIAMKVSGSDATIMWEHNFVSKSRISGPWELRKLEPQLKQASFDH
jgi:hypothetical protein